MLDLSVPLRRRPRVLLSIETGWAGRAFLLTRVVTHLARLADIVVACPPEVGAGVRDLTPSDVDVRVLPRVHSEAWERSYARRNEVFLASFRAGTRRSNEHHRRSTWNITKRIRASMRRAVWRTLLTIRGVRATMAREQALLAKEPALADLIHLLDRLAPDLVVTTSGLLTTEAPLVVAAQQLGIPNLCWIPSWDNPTSKPALATLAEGYIVWSDRMARDLHASYPLTVDRPIWPCGPPHFDGYTDVERFEERGPFCRRLGLDPARPLLFYGMATPHLAPSEHRLVETLIQRLDQLDGPPQLIIRVHPADAGTRLDAVSLPASVLLSRPNPTGSAFVLWQTEADYRFMINCMRHADVVINIASTLSLDAAACDTPVVNPAFGLDPRPAFERRIRDYYQVFEHYRTVTESGAVAIAYTMDELIEHIQEALRRPEARRDARRRLAEVWCGPLDGRASERTAAVILAACSARGAAAPDPSTLHAPPV